MNIESNRLYTVAEIASLLRVSTATIYRQIDYLKIKTIKVGHQHRIWGFEIAEYLRRRAGE